MLHFAPQCVKQLTCHAISASAELLVKIYIDIKFTLEITGKKRLPQVCFLCAKSRDCIKLPEKSTRWRVGIAVQIGIFLM